MNNKCSCIEPYNMYDVPGKGLIKELHVYRVKSENHFGVDLNLFFTEMFGERDKWLGKPLYDRTEKKKDHTIYRFEMREFFEAFIGGYSPDTLAKFFTQHLSDSLQSESLVNRINKAMDNHKVAILLSHQILALNFDVNIINGLLLKKHKSVRRSNFYEKRSGVWGEDNKEYSCSVPVLFYPKKIRAHFLKNDPEILLLFCSDKRPAELNPISMINHYRLPTNEFVVSKKSTGQTQ